MGTALAHLVRPVAADSGWRVWGNDATVQSLKRAASTLPRHAYVISGPNQIGKRLLALEFALALNCPSSTPDGIPCRSCSTCVRIQRGVFPDVTVYDLARQAQVERGTGKNTTLTIDTVRAIGQDLALRPAEAPWRVSIVDDMETMQETAQEAFLKTLEEPPAAAVLLLLTSDIENLLETVRSRCVALTMSSVRAEVIDGALRAAGIARGLAGELAMLAFGLPGWAFAAAGDDRLRDARRALRDEASAWIDAENYDRLVRAVRTADRYGQDKEQVVGLLVTVMLEWRRRLLLSQGLASDACATQGANGPEYPPLQLVQAVQSVRACLADLESNVRPRLALESMVLKWPTTP